MALDVRGAEMTASRERTKMGGGKNASEYIVYTKHFLLETVIGELMLSGNVNWAPVAEEAATEDRDAVPAHLHTRLNPTPLQVGENKDSVSRKIYGVDIHLRDGLKPDEKGRIRGRIEIKCREVSASIGPEVNYYLYLNVFPNEESGNARVRVVAGRGDYGTDKNGFGVQIIKPRE